MINADTVDLISQLQERQIDAVIAHERAQVAAISNDYVAWMMFPPTPSDDPEEYAPYWARLKDIVTDESEREAFVAEWFNQQRLG